MSVKYVKRNKRENITIHFIGGLPNSQGKNSILVVVDTMSKDA